MRLAKLAKIESIGKLVAKKRDEAVKGRKQSGIETIWEEDEEYYEGIDDANRESHPWVKSASTAGGISRTPSRSTTRCTAFFNITRQFVDAASARMGDILLPAGDWNWTVKATPVQDADPGMGELQQAPGAADLSRQRQSEAERKAELAETQMRDWLTECQYHSAVRRVIEDAAKIGVGVLKGPFPDKRIARVAADSAEGTTLELREEIAPISTRIDPWDFFPDPACGDSIHNGAYVFERDRMTAKQLKDLKGVPGYLAEQIDIVLDEGPDKIHYQDGQRSAQASTKDDDRFDVWYYYGLVDMEALSALSVKIEEQESARNCLPAVVTLVNDTPIKAFINPLDTGEFPYDVMPWQNLAGQPWGIGVARQGRTPQDMLNASARALMDNAGLSSGPQIIIRQNAIMPADGKWELTARKVWLATEQADVKSVQDAFTAVNIPMVQPEMTAIIQLAYKMMEDATGILFIMQGQQGSAPDTVGGMELLHRNASAPLRRLARVFDERVTEPHIRRYYEWLLLHGPDECKGDVKIQAVGSTALVEREIQAMESMVLLQMSLNQAYGLDPEKAMTEVLKAKRMIPEKWLLDDAKKQQLSQRPPVIPAVEVAKIRSQDEAKRIELDRWKHQTTITEKMHATEADIDRDRMYVESVARKEMDAIQLRREELRQKKELALLDYANRHSISLDQIKANLSKTAMTLREQRLLATMAGKAPQVATPAAEPPQHAPDGRAFQE